MASITTIQANDLITDSRADINNNFANLNSDKIETSYLDTDTNLAANSDSKIATQKAVKAYVDATSTLAITSEQTTGTTHSLTTTANQKVIVWVKGTVRISGSGSSTIELKYNGVTKDTVALDSASGAEDFAFSLMYTESPGAATANITVVNGGETMSNVVIIVLKF